MSRIYGKALGALIICGQALFALWLTVRKSIKALFNGEPPNFEIDPDG